MGSFCTELGRLSFAGVGSTHYEDTLIPEVKVESHEILPSRDLFETLAATSFCAAEAMALPSAGQAALETEALPRTWQLDSTSTRVTRGLGFRTSVLQQGEDCGGCFSSTSSRPLSPRTATAEQATR